MNSSETLSQLVGQTLTGVAEDLAAARLAVRNLDGYLTTGELVTPVLPPRR